MTGVGRQDAAVLLTTTGLDAAQLAAVQVLEQQVTAHDGGRLKLELGYTQDHPIDVALVHSGEGRLVGYAGLYAFGDGTQPEIAGMVEPGARRRGVGTQLLDALLPLARERGAESVLLVTPATTSAGRLFAESRGATPSHSEHFLVLQGTPTGAEDPAVVVRAATQEDVPELQRILAAAFGHEPGEMLLDRPGDTTYAIDAEGRTVGHVRLSRRDAWGGVYGFGVDPSRQGQGIGRDVLARVCRLLRADGCERVTPEVETQNAGALGLYLSTGFVAEAGEDYYALALHAPDADR